MDTVTVFLGHPAEYWLEVEERMRRSASFDTADLIQEIATLKGKVAFYESRISQMASLMHPRNPG